MCTCCHDAICLASTCVCVCCVKFCHIHTQRHFYFFIRTFFLCPFGLIFFFFVRVLVFFKGKFIAHLARVRSTSEVQTVISNLKVKNKLELKKKNDFQKKISVLKNKPSEFCFHKNKLKKLKPDFSCCCTKRSFLLFFF